MKKLKRSLMFILAMIMVIGTQSFIVFADGEENVVEESSVNVENKENEDRTEKVESALIDEGEKVSEDETIGTEIVDGENEGFVDGDTEIYAMSEEVEPYAEGDVPKSGTCGDNLTWTLSDDGILTISGNGPMRDYTREEPGIVVDFPAPQWVQSVIIEEGVTSIGDYALVSIINRGVGQRIVIPDSVTKIGEGAFWMCFGLEEIEIPNSVSDIGEMAFERCENLKRIKLSNNITNIKNDMFFYCIYLSEIEIPNSVTEIGEDAFYGCGLEKVVLPNGLKSIGYGAFRLCDDLKEVTIPKGVSRIGSKAFQECPLDIIRFEGDAPEFVVGGEGDLEAFWGVTADVYYPKNNPTWTADKMQNYGGTLTWHPWNLYIVEEATDSVYVKGSSNGATIKCTEELGKFISVAVDGVVVDSSNYTVVEGSTVLTFLSSYLDTLSVGDHVVTLNYTYGSVDTTLMVLENGTDTSGGVENTNGTSDTAQSSSMQGGAPKTGDSTKMVVWLFVTVIAGSGCFVLLYVRRKTYLKF